MTGRLSSSKVLKGWVLLIFWVKCTLGLLCSLSNENFLQKLSNDSD